MLRRWFAVGVVAALVAAVGARSDVAAAPTLRAAEPVPSLAPAATARLWRELVRRPQARRLANTECAPLRAVFYAATDWLRLATRLAANPSPCAQYYISVPPLAADKTQLRGDQAWRIRALGPAFHALAEINVTGWTSWVATTGSSWYDAGVEARRRMASSGYDVAAGDVWALNELSSAVRQGTGNARRNMRAFLRGLHDGDGSTAVRGVVFIAGIGQNTSDLSVYQARLQDWYEDAAFWDDLGRFASDWSQEVYGDVRHYAVSGLSREARRDALNEYLQHQAALAAAAPASAAAARSFLGATYAPLANAAWQYDAAFGWTNVSYDLMQDYVSAQTYAMRSAGTGRFGFPWSPKNLTSMPGADFTAQTDALLVRLAAAIADSGQAPDAACGTAWCDRVLDGAAQTTSWRTFGAWKPSQLAFATPAATIAPGAPSPPITVELRTHAGGAYSAGVPVTVELTSSSATGEFASDPAGPWSTSLQTAIATGATTISFYFRDATSGSVTIAAAAAGRTAGTQTVSISQAPAPAPPPPAPAPPPEAPPAPPEPPARPPLGGGGGGSGGGGGAGPDIAVEAGVSPATPAVGGTLTYTVGLRNHGGPASRVFLLVRLPAQVDYAGGESDRGAGCTRDAAAPSILACELDFLAGGLIATVRIHARVREAGALAFSATSSAQPADVQPSNDTSAVVLTLAGARPAPVADPPPALRVIGSVPRPLRRGSVATVGVRFSVSEAVRLRARLTPLRASGALRLLPLSALAGARSSKPLPALTASVRRAGTYTFTARVAAAKLVQGRPYVVRVVAVDSAGRRRTLVIPLRG